MALNSFLNFFYYLFSFIALVSAIMVFISNNPIYSALFLILVFFNSSLLILLLDLEFLALIFILIYIGAIMVLFLFIIMMLDIKPTKLYINVSYYIIISGLFLLFFSIEFLIFISLDIMSSDSYREFDYINWYSVLLELSNIRMLGSYLYTYFSFFFLLAGLTLLIAMIGVISLTLPYLPGEKSSKYQLLYNQLATNPKNSVFCVK